MRRTATLSLCALTIALCGCSSGESAQLTEVRSYALQVAPVASSLETQAGVFEQAMSAGGAPDVSALVTMQASLQTSIDALKAIETEDAALTEAHGHLVHGVETLKSAVDDLVGALNDPMNIPADFETTVTAKTDAAMKEITESQEALALLLPEDERAEFLKE